MKKFLVIGDPIEHSLSPKLHNYWIKLNNLNAIYDKKKLSTSKIKGLIKEIRQKKIKGINVTVPFKNLVIPYLDKLSDEAERTQSVNTIYLKDEILIGHNTDIVGFESSIKHINYDVIGKKVLLLGAGGVSPSIILALQNMKANKIFLSNRTQSKAEDLKEKFNEIEVIKWGTIPNIDMIVNSTSLGLKKSDIIDIDYSKIGSDKFFYDVIYNPSETNFLKLAKRYGNKVENGKLMFIYQAKEAFKLWHGVEPKVNKDSIDLLSND